jgi:hypothetical protein
VNIATYRNIKRIQCDHDIVVCERGPWDTLMDVVVDTSLDQLIGSPLGRLFSAQVHDSKAAVLFIQRSKENILRTRPELIHDYKLDKKIAVFNRSADVYGWHIIENDGPLTATYKQIENVLRLPQQLGY